MNRIIPCPSIYEGIFENPFLFERFILISYLILFLIGIIGNSMTIIIIRFNRHLRTPTDFYLLNLAVSDLMMLMCNLPLEMLEIYHRQWPLGMIFCKLRNICAEFFTCSSILTILAFTCERYFAIVHPVHLHRLSHLRRAQNIILIIWLISLAFSLPIGLSYEIQMNNSNCRSCVPKENLTRILSIIIIISSLCLFYLPMFIIGAIYLFIGRALRRVTKYEGCSHTIEISTPSQTSLSNKDAVEMQETQGSHVNSYSWLKMRARCQARRVVIKTLIAVVIAFFVCYAPLYLQRLLLAILTFYSNSRFDSYLTQLLAYLYVLSGLTFYFGTIINPILYNLVSNKYRRAFRNLICCRFQTTKPTKLMNKSNPDKNQQQLKINLSPQRQTPAIQVDPKQRLVTKTNTSSIKSFEKNKHIFSFLIK